MKKLSHLFFIFFFACQMKTNQESKTQGRLCDPIFKNYSTLKNIDTFQDFIEVIRTRECSNLKKWLDKNFYYVLDDGSFYFSFRQNKNFIDSYYNLRMCDFFFNQAIYDQVIAQLGYDLKNQRLPSERILNSHSIEIFNERDIKNSTDNVTLRIHSCLTENKLRATFPTELYFNCSEKPHSRCILRWASMLTESEY